MKRAAIYARKSTEQRGVTEEMKAVGLQVENARAFAASRAWTVVPEHVYVDDGISGAEFERRPGFMSLMAALAPTAPFEVLIVSELKTIGRETYETNYTVKRLAQAGVEVVEYQRGRSLTPKSALDKAMGVLEGYGAEAHREQTSKRVHEAHEKRARRGFVTGGRVFGYRNEDVNVGTDVHGRPLKSHVERVIVPEQAEVVRRIFELAALGLGLKAIAKQLTAEGRPHPEPYTRRSEGTHLACPPPVAGWSPSTVRAILQRDLYRGRVVWNRSKKRDDWGQVDQRPREPKEWVEAVREDLRIISEELWRQVHEERREANARAVRFANGRLSGRPPKGRSQNLLPGLATCGVCGGGLVVETGARRDGRLACYVCHRRRHHGTCANALWMPVALVDEAVLRAIESHALTPEAVESVIQLAERDDHRERQAQLQSAFDDCEQRIRMLTRGLEVGGGDVRSLVERLRELERERARLVEEQTLLKPLPRLPAPVVSDHLAEWRRLLRGSTTQARAVLQRILRGRIVFRPLAGQIGYEFSCGTRFDRLFAGVAVQIPAFLPVGDLTGTEHIRPEDTPDGDYAAVLERAQQRIHGKGMASPTGFEPVFWP